jgi:hypothetical protein
MRTSPNTASMLHRKSLKVSKAMLSAVDHQWPALAGSGGSWHPVARHSSQRLARNTRALITRAWPAQLLVCVRARAHASAHDGAHGAARRAWQRVARGSTSRAAARSGHGLHGIATEAAG